MRRKLQYAVDQVGSLNSACALAGVNRTQFSRYLSGQSIPRPDVLYRLSGRLNLPLEWFFDNRDDDLGTLAEHQFGRAMRTIARGRRFLLDDMALPQGIYAMWKRTFTASLPYEMLLGRAWSENGVKWIKFGVRWWRSPIGGGLPSGSERHYRALAQRSTTGLFLYTANGPENRIITFFLRESDRAWNSPYQAVYSGMGASGDHNNSPGMALAPTFLGYLGNPGFRELRALLQAAGGYQAEQLPQEVRRALDGIDESFRVPET